MRNLKKILALALALVMSMSLMATANAFSDDEKITDTYETAVTVLSGLKVFQGYDEGDFRPQGAITRAEVAAIIYRIVTGDVEDTQVGIYADYNKFDDVKSTSWYAGYVNFCANAEYIKGYDAKTFGPNDPVTGYQALAMILRALGYDKNGEFTGTNWQVQTAAVGEDRGITKNVTAGTLGVAATREVVAEILFRAILVDTVNYTPAFGYQIGDTSLGYETFKLEEIEGVVVANEYADLYSGSPMKAGRTEMIVDGDSYVIDYTSTLEDIGENHAAYITEGKNVLTIEKTGNTVFETGDEKDISTNSKFENVTGLTKGDAEEYVNFGGDGDAYESDFRIEFEVSFSAIAGHDAWWVKANFADEYGIAAGSLGNQLTYEKVIRAGDAITENDLAIIKGIFAAADDSDETEGIQGAVYVGTRSNAAAEDVSDDMSYRAFYNEYITEVGDNAEVNYNENGNWLKVIDNDGDGEADYVLKTVYTAAGVEDINRDDEIELTPLYDNLDSTDSMNQLTTSIDVVTADELSEGDVVYYAVIDGNAQTYLADVVTAEIDKVNRNTLTATTTDGDEYIQSGVHNHVNWDGYDDGVRNLEGDTSYDLYLDKYGYLMVFTETAYTGNFVLITDGYFESGRTEDVYGAMVWDGEDLVDTDITSGGDLFIDDNRNDNDWDNLKAFRGINDDDDSLLTIVAALSEDGDLVPVEDSTNSHDVRVIAIDDNEVLGRNYTDGSAYITDARGWDDGDTAYDWNFDNDVEIRALSTTVYYFVYQSRGETIVDEYVGYANVPSLYEDDKALIQDVYAVGTLVDRESGLGNTDYYTANVVVVELDGNYRADAEQVFIYDTPVVGSSVKTEEVSMIRADGSAATVEIDLTRSTGIFNDAYGIAGDKRIMPGLFYMWETNDDGVYIVERMTNTDIANNKYAVGQVSTSLATLEYDWVEVQLWNHEGFTTADLDNTDTGARKTFGYVAGESQVYGLDYSVEEINWRGDYTLVAELDEDIDAADALDERVDISRTQNAAQENQNDAGTLFWNKNDVLVSYNGDGEIVYAVSFNNYHSYSAAELDDLPIVAQNIDFAQYVWNAVKPAAKETFDTARPTVTKGDYDLKWGVSRDIDGSISKITIPYTVWSADGFKDYAYVVSPATGNQIAISGLTTFTSEDVEVAVDTGDASATVSGEQTIVVHSQGDNNDVTKTYTFLITYANDATGTDLYLKSDANKTPLDKAPVVNTYDGSKNVSLENLKDNYYAHNGASWSWTFVDGNGDEVGSDVGINDVAYAVVTVTAATPNTEATYIIEFNQTSHAAAGLAKALKATGASTEDVIEALETAGYSADADIAAAMKAINAPVDEVYAGWVKAYSLTSDSYDDIATALKNAGYESADIVTGFIDSDVDTGLVKGAGSSISGIDGEYIVALDATDGDIIAGNLAAVVSAAGCDLANVAFSWTDSNNGSYGPMGWTDWSNQWTAMRNAARTGMIEYYVTITCDDLTLSVDLVAAE